MDPLQLLQTSLSDRYEIVREVGAGGMATVYLARDLRHDRQVALKLLRPELAAVLGVDRFLSEIRVTANLQHPHLLPLFDSGQADGLLFYVMPYVEGESLRARLERERQLPVDEALRLTVAIAGALDYAHRHSVVHRDLKPENILLHDGQPLVSDFGIALAVTNAGGTRVTQTGLSLGTPQYMSPEQATGDRVVDARSDIYSLAAVLYEMLTGEPPHTGATVQALIARVLTDRPRSVRGTRDTVPEHVDAALQKALAKLPADRFATAHAFADALQNPRAFLTTMSADGSANAGAGAARTSRSRALVTGRAAAPWVIALAAIGLAAYPRERAVLPDALPTTRFTIELPDDVQPLVRGTPFAVSPDGLTVLFTARTQGRPFMLYARRLDAVDAVPVAGTEGARNAFFSPDNTQIGFWADGRLKVATVTGGGAVTLTGAPVPVTASWGGDGVILYSTGPGSGLWRIPASGGTPEAVTALDTARGETFHIQPHFLPDGRQFVFVRYGISDVGMLAVGTLDGTVRDLGITGMKPQYVNSGHLVYNTFEGHLMTVPFDARRGVVTGPSAVALENVLLSASGTAYSSVSRNGTLAFETGEIHSRLVAVARDGTVQPLLDEPRGFRMPRVAPDGNRIVVEVTSSASERDSDLWLFDRRSGTLSRFTTGSGSTDPLWTPDGSRLAYAQLIDGVAELVWRASDGSGTTEVLAELPGAQWPWSFTPDGQTLIFDETVNSRAIQISQLGIADRQTTSLIASMHSNRLPKLSPDGRWLTYTSNESGAVEVYVVPYPSLAGKVRISTDGGDQPMWSRDGRELFYRDGTSMIAARIQADPDFAVTSRSVLFRDDFAMSNATNYDVLLDGRFVMLQPVAGQLRMHVITNWKVR